MFEKGDIIRHNRKVDDPNYDIVVLGWRQHLIGKAYDIHSDSDPGAEFVLRTEDADRLYTKVGHIPEEDYTWWQRRTPDEVINHAMKPEWYII